VEEADDASPPEVGGLSMPRPPSSAAPTVAAAAAARATAAPRPEEAPPEDHSIAGSLGARSTRVVKVAGRGYGHTPSGRRQCYTGPTRAFPKFNTTPERRLLPRSGETLPQQVQPRRTRL